MEYPSASKAGARGRLGRRGPAARRFPRRGNRLGSHGAAAAPEGVGPCPRPIRHGLRLLSPLAQPTSSSGRKGGGAPRARPGAISAAPLRVAGPCRLASTPAALPPPPPASVTTTSIWRGEQGRATLLAPTCSAGGAGRGAPAAEANGPEKGDTERLPTFSRPSSGFCVPIFRRPLGQGGVACAVGAAIATPLAGDRTRSSEPACRRPSAPEPPPEPPLP